MADEKKTQKSKKISINPLEFNEKIYSTLRGKRIAQTKFWNKSLLDLKQKKQTKEVKKLINQIEKKKAQHLEELKQDIFKKKELKKANKLKSKEIKNELKKVFDNDYKIGISKENKDKILNKIVKEVKEYHKIEKKLNNKQKIKVLNNIEKLNNKFEIEKTKIKDKKQKDKKIQDLRNKYNGNLDNLTIDPKNNSTDYYVEVLKMLKNTGNKYTIEYKYKDNFGNTTSNYYTLNDLNFKKLINFYKKKVEYEEYITGVSISDYQVEIMIDKLISINIKKIIPDVNKRKYKFNDGQFFKYYHKIKDLDLSSLQIYNKDEDIDINNNCFIHSLINSNLIEAEKIQEIKLFCKTRDIPMLKIKEIADKFNLYITIKKNDNIKEKLIKYGDKSNPEIKIGLLDNHYFIIKEIPITSYAIKNYNDVKDFDNFNSIFKKRNDRGDNKYKRDNKRFINSFQVVKLLLENKDLLLEKIDYSDEKILTTPYFNEINEINHLEYSKKNISLEYNEFKPKKEDKFINIYFDFETITENKHIPYLCCYCDKNGKNKTFYGEDSGKKLLYDLTKQYPNENIRLIAHNAGYDFRFIYQYLTRLEVIDRGKMLLRAYGVFYYEKTKFIKIEIQDSFALIPMKLSNFSKTFKIDCKKEFIPYNMYNESNIKKRLLTKSEVKKYCNIQVENSNIGVEKSILDLKKKIFHKEFIKNCNDWNCVIDGKIDIIDYSKRYCLMDCKVLKEGYETFKGWIYDITKLNINNYISLPSLSNEYMKSQGVFKDVYALSGTPQFFINKCMVGGRTMISNNEKIKLEPNENIKLNIQDFDAVSLYPSAMNRMKGYLKGKPKVISKNNLNYEYLKEKDGYFIEIKINKVNIKRKFSLMSEINNDGVRVFHNDMENKKIYVDKISLEDLIEFQKVEFDIIRGYYYNEGRNDKLKDVIFNLFNERLKKKQEGNQIQEVYKLLLNSAYGKTLLKPIDDETIYITSKNYDNYVIRHYNYIKEIVKLNDYTYKIKLIKSIDTHFNNVSCGVEVLSMSKRIMNEVICNAEDLKIPIYYQDTDSLHIDKKNIDKLAKFYKEKYDRVLIGKNMGQFHSDFNSDIIKKDIRAVRSIFLGKKIYVNELKGLDENNNEVIDYHIRLKGVNIESIYYECEKRNINPFQLFELLFNSEEIEFDLGCGGKKINFQFNKDLTITNNEDFKRKIKFKNN